jgi:hypothetical protein
MEYNTPIDENSNDSESKQKVEYVVLNVQAVGDPYKGKTHRIIRCAVTREHDHNPHQLIAFEDQIARLQKSIAVGKKYALFNVVLDPVGKIYIFNNSSIIAPFIKNEDPIQPTEG